MDFNSYRLKDKSAHYKRQIAKHFAEWVSRLQVHWGLDCLFSRPNTDICILYAFKMSCNKSRVHQGSLIGLVLLFWNNCRRSSHIMALFKLQSVLWLRQRRYARIIHRSGRSPIANLCNRRYDHQNSRYWNFMFYPPDRHVAITIQLCPMNVIVALPISLQWICTGRNVLWKAYRFHLKKHALASGE